MVLNRNNQYLEAIEAFQKALEIDSNNAFIWSHLGLVLNNNKQYSEAIDAFQKALEIDPNNATVCNNLGIRLHESKQYVKAKKYFRMALNIDSNNATIWYNLGNTLIMTKQYSEAIDAFNQALSINPELDSAKDGIIEAKKAQEQSEEDKIAANPVVNTESEKLRKNKIKSSFKFKANPLAKPEGSISNNMELKINSQFPLIVLDGSNIARWKSQSDIPSIKDVIICRDELINLGIPSNNVIIIFGPGIRSAINDEENKSLFDQLLKNSNAKQAPPGANDDWFIIQFAKRHQCLIITNDRYNDHKKMYPKDKAWLNNVCIPFFLDEGVIFGPKLYEFINKI